MRKFLFTLLLALAGSAAAQQAAPLDSVPAPGETTALPPCSPSENHAKGVTTGWFVGADFDFYFDNLEASGCAIDNSGTLFAVRLAPYVGWQFAHKHALVLGADLRSDFGDSVKFLSSVRPNIYYRYRGARWQANAGAFPRHLLQGEYSDFLMQGTWIYDNYHVMGLSGSYVGESGLWEAGISWDGLYSDSRRELFRIFSAGRYDFHPHWYFGYEFQLTHLAKSKRQLPDEGVVDYIALGPYFGATFNAFFDFDLRAHVMLSYQRDRIVDNKKFPVGGQFDFSMSKWGFTLRDNIYVGANQLPFYEKYGTLLYGAFEFYAAKKNFYNHTALSYSHSFFHDIMSVGASFDLHFDGKGVAFEQAASLKVNLEKLWKTK